MSTNLLERPSVLSQQNVDEEFNALAKNIGLTLGRFEWPDFNSPAGEIYGRSLSSIRRCGAFMVGKSLAETISSPEAAQARAEFFTSVEEGFGTDKELGGGLEVRDFDRRPVMNGKVMAKDFKTAISDMTHAGLICAEKTARGDLRFLPQLTRSRWDHQNALLVDEMVQGKTGYNMRLVASPFPKEAAASSGNEFWRDIGYVPHLDRGFVQMYLFNGTELIAGSLSFDGSNKDVLRQIFAKHGVEIPEDEVTDNWLKYAITANLDEAAAMRLATEIANQAGSGYQKNTNTVDVTREYKPLMDQAFNQSYIHLCESLYRKTQTSGVRGLINQLAAQAQSFNPRYRSALYDMQAKQSFNEDDSIVLHELLVYSTIEMMRALHLRKMDTEGTSVFNPAHMQNMNAEAFQNILSHYGAQGARNNRSYSACGLAIAAGGDSDSSVQEAFGGMLGEKKADNEADDKYGSLTFECPKGHTNTRPRNKLIEKCKTCGTSVKC